MTDNGQGSRILIHYITAAMLLACFCLLLGLSYGFDKTGSQGNTETLVFIVLLMLGALAYLAAIIRGPGTNHRSVIFFIFTAGLVFRLVTMFSTPVLEVDFYRYMWDGSVTASGINPYSYSPGEVVSGDTGNKELERLAAGSGGIIEKINHKHLRTIYPPVTQLFFAVSHIINPWSLLTWKVVLLVIDIFNFFLLAGILKKLNISASNSLIYWWNPLLISTSFNAAHFDIIPVFFVLGSILLLLYNRHKSSLLSLALGTGAKLWPVFLAPLFLSSGKRSMRDFYLNGLILAGSVIAIFIPVFLSGLSPSSGFVAYSMSWENNSSAFRVFLFIFEGIFEYAGIHPGHAQRYTRVFVLSLILVSTLYLFIRRQGRGHLFNNLLIVVALLFLLSPTQFPWYYTWLLPFIVIKPVRSLLVLTLLLPLYYSAYYFGADTGFDTFGKVIVWIEFVPVWILIFYEWRTGKFFGTSL